MDLTGIINALLSQGVTDRFEGAYVHGNIADKLATQVYIVVRVL